MTRLREIQQDNLAKPTRQENKTQKHIYPRILNLIVEENKLTVRLEDKRETSIPRT